MFLTYMAVRNVEVAAERYSFARYTSSKKKNMDMSQRVMIQGIPYSAALASLCLTFTLGIIINSLNLTSPSYVVQVLGSILLPLQGFWNALIYMTPLFRQILKKRCKSRQQNISNSMHDSQTTSKGSWLSKSFRTFYQIRKRISKESKNSTQQLEVQDGEDLEGNNSVGVFNKVNNKEEEKMSLSLNTCSSRRVVMFKEKVKSEEDSNALTSSSLMLSCAEYGEADKSLSFTALSQNSELKNEELSQLEYFSALDVVNTECCDNVEDEDNSSDDESYVDDYLKMMEIE